jgi:ribosome-interacting GTPase 1
MIWEKLDLVQVYTRKAKDLPNFGDPIVLTNERNGRSVKSIC